VRAADQSHANSRRATVPTRLTLGWRGTPKHNRQRTRNQPARHQMAVADAEMVSPLLAPECTPAVELHLNRRMQSFTALKSWTRDVFTAFNSWKELHSNRRQRWSFGSEISSVEIIGTERYILRKRGLPAAISGHEIKGEFLIPRIECSFKYSVSTNWGRWIGLQSTN